MTAPMVDYKIHWLKMMSVPESRAVVGRHDGINGRNNRKLRTLDLVSYLEIRCRGCWARWSFGEGACHGNHLADLFRGGFALVEAGLEWPASGSASHHPAIGTFVGV